MRCAVQSLRAGVVLAVSAVRRPWAPQASEARPHGNGCETISVVGGTYTSAGNGTLTVDRIAKTVTWTFVQEGNAFVVNYPIKGAFN